MNSAVVGVCGLAFVGLGLFGLAASYVSDRRRATMEAMGTRRSQLVRGIMASAALAIGGFSSIPWMLWAGVAAFVAYDFVATLQEDADFGRILAANGGIFVAGSLAWGMAVDGFRPDRYDYLGATICLVGVAVMMFAPDPAESVRIM